MNRAFLFCFDKWWRPVMFYVFIAGLVVIDSELKIQWLKIPLNYLVDTSIVALLISFVFQLYKGRHLQGWVNIFILFVTGMISWAIQLTGGDHWADDLKIPKGIQIEKPIAYPSVKTDSILHVPRTETDLILYDTWQPGMYRYDFWTNKTEAGVIYLKAFEITQEEELSSDNLKSESRMSIHLTLDSIERFSSTREFTIYEGDWGKYYAARFEVWFKPNFGGPEMKLFQKNFKIEGWMF